MRIQQRIDAAREHQFKEMGINTAWFDVLAQLQEGEGMTQQELSERLFVTKGNVSQLLVKMEQSGLVKRESEGRCRCVWLTDAGKDLAARALPLQEQRIKESLVQLTEQQVATLVELLGLWEQQTRSINGDVRRR